MAWRVEITETANKQLKKLDKLIAERIINYLKDISVSSHGPRSKGEALSGPLGDLWRYRVGDYRIFCDIQDDKLRILMVRIGHRSDVYR